MRILKNSLLVLEEMTILSICMILVMLRVKMNLYSNNCIYKKIENDLFKSIQSNLEVAFLQNNI